MNPAGRLSVFGVALAVVFAIVFAAARLVSPEQVIAGHRSTPVAPEVSGKETQMNGLSLEQAGLALGPIHAPGQAGVAGELSFQVLDADGRPTSAFATWHERQMHLMVVRSDGTGFRHVHPDVDAATGTWTLPWTWDAAGTYRVYADFVPADGANTHPVTLSRTVDVAGIFNPQQSAKASASDSVDGFEVTVAGNLVAGQGSELTMEVSRDGRPVTNLEAYLGAYGHLVALREGDLAYLHVHAEGAEPAAGDTSGPAVRFMAHAPTPGRYLMYLDFQVDGQVHTARFVLESAPGDGSGAAGHGGMHGHSGH